MCTCRHNCAPFCPCPCHGHHTVIGPTRAGKAYMMAAAMANAEWKRDHPHGVVTGKVVADSGEIESHE